MQPKEQYFSRAAGKAFEALDEVSQADYIQDDWRVSRRLPLNLGLRWDLQFTGFLTHRNQPRKIQMSMRFSF
jgi:hypothetical protein